MRKKESAAVLIVDDDSIILNIVAEQMSLFGYQPIIASCGEEALGVALKQTKIDLLLTGHHCSFICSAATEGAFVLDCQLDPT